MSNLDSQSFTKSNRTGIRKQKEILPKSEMGSRRLEKLEIVLRLLLCLTAVSTRPGANEDTANASVSYLTYLAKQSQSCLVQVIWKNNRKVGALTDLFELLTNNGVLYISTNDPSYECERERDGGGDADPKIGLSDDSSPSKSLKVAGAYLLALPGVHRLSSGLFHAFCAQFLRQPIDDALIAKQHRAIVVLLLAWSLVKSVLLSSLYEGFLTSELVVSIPEKETPCRK